MSVRIAKPQVAGQIESRSRAKQLGVRVEVVIAERHYRTRSQSVAGCSYNLDRTSAGWECECYGYQFHGYCKHLGALERRSEREGWAFGKIARIQRAA